MDEKITMAGVAVLVAGLLLLFGFMPLIGESADDMSDDYENGNFEGYDTGDRVTVYGKVSDVEYQGAWNLTKVILDEEDGAPIYIEGNVTGSMEKGDRVYIKCFVDDFRILGQDIEYLRANADGIHSQTLPNIIFILIIISGIVVMAVGIRSI